MGIFNIIDYRLKYNFGEQSKISVHIAFAPEVYFYKFSHS